MVTSLFCAGLSIRRARASDLAAVAVVQRTAILKLGVSSYGVEGAEAWARWQVADARRLLSQAGAVFVAENNAHDVVAVGSWCPDARAVEVAWVCAVFVSPELARRGVGRSVMATVEESAAMADRSLLRLNASDNAKPFYEALGYKAIETRFWEIEPGLVVPCTLMEKPTPTIR